MTRTLLKHASVAVIGGVIIAIAVVLLRVPSPYSVITPVGFALVYFAANAVRTYRRSARRDSAPR